MGGARASDFTGRDGVYTPCNCAMIFVRAYVASRWLREPDENQVEDPPIRRLTSPALFEKLKDIIGVDDEPNCLEGKSE